uniref:Tetratricopeptide repeat protein n=1 Tax=Ammonifex degensii TaxID=42838 RepID=A0A7C2IVE6_9THEO
MLSFRARKKWMKAVFWVLTVALGAGLVGSSVVWTSLPKEPAEETVARQQDTVDAQIAKAVKRQDISALLLIAGRCADGGDVKRAQEVYRKVLKLAPDNEAARLSLVELCFTYNNYDEALSEVEAILKKAPDHQKALYYRGLIRGYGKKDYAGAVADLKRFVSLAGSGREVEEASALIKEWSSKR